MCEVGWWQGQRWWYATLVIRVEVVVDIGRSDKCATLMMWLMFGSSIVVNPHYLLRGERKLSINVRRLPIGLTTHSAEHPTCWKATYVASSWWTCAISPITPSQLWGGPSDVCERLLMGLLALRSTWRMCSTFISVCFLASISFPTPGLWSVLATSQSLFKAAYTA